MDTAAIQELITSADVGDRLRGINQLRSLDPNDAFTLIQPLSQDENARVRYAAVSQIASLGHVNLNQAHDLLRDRLLMTAKRMSVLPQRMPWLPCKCPLPSKI